MASRLNPTGRIAVTHRRRKGLLTRILLAAFFLSLTASGESPDGGLGNQVKAMFLFNLAKFVEWPAEKMAAGTPIVIGIIGQDPFGGSLEKTLRGKTVSGRALTIRRLTELTDVEVKGCHILFISASEKKRITQILQKVKIDGVLTMAEVKGFAEQGGMVNLTTRDDTVGLEVNANAVERARIKISYKLLRLARIVQEQNPRGKS